MQPQDNLDHHNLLDMKFICQPSPYAGGAMVYSLKKDINRGNVFLLKLQVKQGEPSRYEVRIASYWENEMESEWLRDVSTVQELKDFYKFALNVTIE
ncbi:MAG: hypothetical protein ACHP6H_03220 [Legionellales bacterium]